MADIFDLAVRDPVAFTTKNQTRLAGHVAHKTPKTAMVATRAGPWKVPWGMLEPDSDGVRKRVLLPVIGLKARFRPDDEVEFLCAGEMVRGVIARFGPERALVVSDAGEDYTVGYRYLRALRPNNGRRAAEWLEKFASKADILLDEHGLEEWSFQYDDAISRMGVCSFGTRVISLSLLYCLNAPVKSLRNTLLHEIAHALVGPDHCHDSVWRARARSIGCTGERCGRGDPFAPPRYIVHCRNCRWKGKRNIRRRGRFCGTCWGPLAYRTYTRRAWEAPLP